MPGMITTTHFGPEETSARRFRVKATGETGVALGKPGVGHADTRPASIGPRNVHLIDLCNEETGEVRTYLASFLEEIRD